MAAETYEIGDIVKCFQDPVYWDDSDNSENPEDYNDYELVEHGEHPGFCDEMYEMIGNTFEVKMKHPNMPWVMLSDSQGHDWWWHYDWIALVKQSESLSEADRNSKYYQVILKIKRMQDKRARGGYAF